MSVRMNVSRVLYFKFIILFNDTVEKRSNRRGISSTQDELRAN